MQSFSARNTCLLIIDVQLGAFDGQKLTPIDDAELFLATVAKLIEDSRKNDLAIVFVQDCGQTGGAFEKNSRHWPIHPAIKSDHSRDKVILKSGASAFEETELHSYLKGLDCDHVIITGLHSDRCVLASCRAAIDLGYSLTLVEDAHRAINDQKQSAFEKQEKLNQSVRKLGGQLVPSMSLIEYLSK